MSLASISIQRPVLAIVMSITIMIVGLVGFNYLGVREYPSVDPPIITVSTNYSGANASVIESQITEPLEESINGIAGINSLTSVSRDGRSTISVEFDLDVDLEAAANDVRDRVSRAQRSLPPDTDQPIVSKADANSFPIIITGITSKKRSLLELSLIAENIFKERLQTISGVSEVRVWGDKRYSMRLWIDPIRLAAYQLTPVDVLNSVNRNNVELPTGRVEGMNTELTVRTSGLLNTPQDFNNLIIKEDANGIVKFKDIGRAELAPENERTILKRDGIPMVMPIIIAQPGANQIEIAEEFYKRYSGIIKDLPEDIEPEVMLDSTRYIKESILEVEQTIVIAFSLVVIIIFMFLRDWRTTIIPVITIPISLIGSFFFIYVMGFSINVLTLLGIVLAIGLVVDDTIVVLENIYKKIESGDEPKEAGEKGTEEIFFAVISTTVALVAVFMPLIFLQGLTGRLFREFGVVIAGAVVISSFVALTMTPMLCTKLLKKRQKKHWIYEVTEPFFISLNRAYNRSLESFMKVRWLSFVIMGIAIAMVYVIYIQLPREMAPLEDRNTFRIVATGPEGVTFEYMDNYVDEILDSAMAKIPERRYIGSVTSPGFGESSSVNSAFLWTKLVDADKRKRSQQQIVQDITPVILKNTKARAFVIQPQTIGSRGLRGLPVQFVIQAPNLEDLKEVLPNFMERAYQQETFSFVNLDLKFNKPEINIEIDREKARALGVSVLDIAQTLQLGFSGQRFGYFIMDGKQYQIIGQVSRDNRNDPLDLQSIYVRSQNDDLIQLDNLVKLREQSNPPQLYRYNRFVSATVSASLAPGYTVGNGIDVMESIADEVLPESFQTALSGSSSEFQESSSSLIFAFVFALILIYLALSAQFESFKDPFIIMFTVPLAMLGAMATLMIFGETLNIFSQIGIIMLIGLVTKNGILIVEFANQRKAQGEELTDAIIYAAEARFRPILMTSLSTILGILPIALALGAGSESRVSMGLTVIGGLIFATVLTLYIIPAIYSYLSGKEKRVARFDA
jgi:multidrug efflux pump